MPLREALSMREFLGMVCFAAIMIVGGGVLLRVFGGRRQGPGGAQ